LSPNTQLSLPSDTARDGKRLLLSSRNNLDSPQTSFNQTPRQATNRIFNGLAFPQFCTSTSIIVEESHIEPYGDGNIAINADFEPRQARDLPLHSSIEINTEDNFITDGSFVNIRKEVKLQNLFPGEGGLGNDDEEDASSFATNRANTPEKRFMPINTKIKQGSIGGGHQKIGRDNNSKDIRTPCFQIMSPNQLISEGNVSRVSKGMQRTNSVDMNSQMVNKLNLGPGVGDMKEKGNFIHRKVNSFMPWIINNGRQGSNTREEKEDQENILEEKTFEEKTFEEKTFEEKD